MSASMAAFARSQQSGNAKNISEEISLRNIPSLLFERNPQAMCIVDKKSLRIIAANRSATTLYRYRNEELLALSLYELCDQGEHERLQLLQGSPVDRNAYGAIWKQCRKDNKVFRVRATWASVGDSDDALLWVLEDQLPIDSARAAARDAGLSLSILMGDAPHGILHYQVESGVVGYANGAMLSVCGLNAGESQIYEPQALESCFVQVIEADSFVRATMARPAFEQQALWRGYDGVLRSVRIHGYPMAEGTAERIIQIEDVTAQNAVMQQSEQSEKMESLGRVAATVAHDFNNILLVMRGYAEMLKRTLPPSSIEGRHAAALLAAADSAAEVTSALVGFTRKDEQLPERLDLNELVHELGATFFPTLQERINGRLALSEQSLTISAVRGQMQRMLLNLAANARDAMPGGGQLTVSTGLRQGAGAGASECYVEIYDSGVGMDEATRARIFERFFTTKAAGRGTGLGLAFVEACMTQLGGRVEVESQLGTGSCFRLVFICEEPAQRLEPLPFEPDRRRGTILLVEDDEHIRALVTDFLKMLDCEVLSVSNAEEALQVLDEHTLRVDLLLTDVTLPGMSGNILAERVRKQMPSVSVLLMSGLAQTEHLKAAGFDVIAKPFSVAEMQRQIGQILDNKTCAVG